MKKITADNKILNIKGQYVDIYHEDIYPAEMQLENGIITAIHRLNHAPNHYILPGFVDAHVHIESSLLVPSEFARLAVLQGTVATVSDPHEIANVCGMPGIEYMIENGNQTPFKFYFGAPSCVPATPFETAGAEIGLEDLDILLGDSRIHYLAEMMNWPGVIARSPEVMDKILLAAKHGKPVDGHAPSLLGEKAKQYISAGITTDHECVSLDEATYKASLGMKIAIREGSAAKNFDALIDLIDTFPDRVMFCSDDKHPDSLLVGHINQLVAKAVSKGKNLFDILRAATLNPISHYRLRVGTLRIGDPADFILTEDLKHFKVVATYIDGQMVAENGQTMITCIEAGTINKFEAQEINPSDLAVSCSTGAVRVIEAKNGQLVTSASTANLVTHKGNLHADIQQDILKIAVINRYEKNAKPAVAFIRNIGLKKGAIASSVAHDSHNIVVVGVDDQQMADAVNVIIREKGGLSLADEHGCEILPLPVAGLMSTNNGFTVAEKYTQLDRQAKERLGSTLTSPYMTLSFMALLVIPSLKLSDKGLFDGGSFEFVPLCLD